MKKLMKLLLILLTLTITGCKTTKEVEKIELPPKPQREILESPKDLKGIAELLNYYEHLVQQWEAWSKSVDAILEEN